ncbi:MAG: GAF domain-containing protein [Chlorobi bacterium]|nr:GAF domain-containing protein [Chlorobiota bacterium]
MDKEKKRGRYQRIYKQLVELVKKSDNKQARMATIIAVLYHKMDYFFWIGFYMLQENKLIVSLYQGPVACMELKKDVGVCWEGINSAKPIVVPDVEKFPGHIACDSRSKSELVLPVWNKQKEIIGVLDVDSKDYNSFDEVDIEELTAILNLI